MFKKRYASVIAPFIGNGTLKEYKDKKDSWIIKQIEDGKVEPGISVSKDDFIRFSSIKKKIASKIVLSSNYVEIVKEGKQLSSTTTNNYRYLLRWTLKGDINNSTVNEINLVKDLLWSKVDNDIQELSFKFNTSLDKMSEVKIDFENRNLYCECVLIFTVNILTDSEKILDELKKSDFIFGE